MCRTVWNGRLTDPVVAAGGSINTDPATPDANNEMDPDDEDSVVEFVEPDADHEANLVAHWTKLMSINDVSTMFPVSLPYNFASYSTPALAPPSTSPLIFDFKIPRGYKDAMRSKHAQHWQLACNAEFDALQTNNTWVLVKQLPDMCIVQNKWVFDVKVLLSLDPASVPRVDRFKARLVARGDSQVYGINYDEVYAPVVRFVSLRIILHLAAIYDLDVDQGDFCNAFLNGKLAEKDIYMTQPEGYVSDPTLVCHLQKSLYGLKQSARQWYACLHDCVSSFGMVRTSSDQAIWTHGVMQLILLAHVDDVLLIGKSKSLREHIGSTYKFKYLGPASLFSGIYIIRDRPSGRLFLDQAPYVRDILDEFQMTHCTPSAIPMDLKESWADNPEDIPLTPAERKL